METKKDYLDADDPIRNQSYVCLSFLCPEQFIHEKNVYFTHKFLDNTGNDVKQLLENLETFMPQHTDMTTRIRETYSYLWDHDECQERYRNFVNMNSTSLEDDFHKLKNGTNTIRGVKVRGVYNSLDEAKSRAEILRLKDPKHNIWVGEVGLWLPLSDNPYDSKDTVYAESALNDLMQKYNENQVKIEEFFFKRKQDQIDASLNKKVMEDQQDGWLEAKEMGVDISNKISELKISNA
jgi:hypothetical protein